MTEGKFGYGQQTPADGNSDYNAVTFLIRQMMARLATMMPVKVVAVQAGGGALAAAGTVSAQPLVTMLDGNGNAMNHGVLASLAYFRLQGGANAVIIDPVVGDLGFAVFAMRDISSVVANKGMANPGSLRQHDMADGVYVGGILNGAPTQYLAFADAMATLAAAAIALVGPVSITGTLAVSGSVQVEGGTPITRALAGSVTTNFGGSIAANGNTAAFISVPGAKVGDPVVLGRSLNAHQSLTIDAYVASNNTVTVYALNTLASLISGIASATYNVLVFGTT